MTTMLSMMVLVLANGTESKTLMLSSHCRLDLLWAQSLGARSFRTKAGVEILEFQCRPFRMEAQS